jgi:hypothetical protein
MTWQKQTANFVNKRPTFEQRLASYSIKKAFCAYSNLTVQHV